MRILQLIQAKQYRGAEIFCCQLSNHLLELGHEVKIISIYEGSAILPFKNSVSSLKRLKWNRYFDIIGWRKLNDLIKEFKPDVIQANAADTLKYAVFSKLAFKWSTPIVYRNASASSFYIQNMFSRKFNEMLLKKVDLILSVSDASKKDLNFLFPFTKPKSFMIPVGIEQQEVASVEIFNKNKINIIHAGSFTREKNHIGLINIFKILNTENSDLVLHLIGDGDLREEIEFKIEQEKLEDLIVLHGGIKEPLTYIKAADILVLPSIVEGLPGVILEAMYCKTPVIAYNVGGVSEVVKENTGVLIEKGDENAFAEAIKDCVKNPKKAQIENAFKMVKNHFLNQRISKEFLKKYESIVAKY